MHPFFLTSRPLSVFFFFFFFWGQLSGGSCSRDRLSVSRVARIEEDPVTRCFGCFIIIYFFTVPPTKAACAFLRGSLFFCNMQVSFPLPGISLCYSTASARSKSSHCLPPLSALSTPPCTRRDVCHNDDGPVLLSPTSAILSVPIAFLFPPCLFPLSFFLFSLLLFTSRTVARDNKVWFHAPGSLL